MSEILHSSFCFQQIQKLTNTQKSESESKPGLLESGSHDAGIGIRIGINVFLGNTGIGIRLKSLATGIRMRMGTMDFGKP